MRHFADQRACSLLTPEKGVWQLRSTKTPASLRDADFRCSKPSGITHGLSVCDLFAVEIAECADPVAEPNVFGVTRALALS